MFSARPCRKFAFIACAICISAADLGAATFSFGGTFLIDDQHQNFVITAPSSLVTIHTFGYAGGTNANGQLIAQGGFDPVLSLFDSTGGLTLTSPLVAFTDTSAFCPNGPDPSTGSCFDEELVLTTLLPGNSYTLVLTQSNNYPNGGFFGDGFSQDGNGNFTPGAFGCFANAFCDSNFGAPGQARTGNWALDILGVGNATGPSNVPEPGGPWVPAAGFGGLFLLQVRRLRKALRKR
jgi:hypothetical protein